MKEQLAIVYPHTDCEYSGIESLRESNFLYGSHWQEGKFWLRPYHLDRLRSESLIDKGFPLAIVRRGLQPNTQYNVLLLEDSIHCNSDLTLSQLYSSTIGRPELYMLILAEQGSIREFHETCRSMDGELLLTAEEKFQLEAWTRLRKVQTTAQFLLQINGDFRKSHSSKIEQWREEVKYNYSWLSKAGFTQDCLLDESFYKRVIGRVIDDILVDSRVAVGSNVGTQRN